MAFRRLCICDNCGNQDLAYAPAGWRTAIQSSRDLNGVEIHNKQALCCSDQCELEWRQAVAAERFMELQGNDN